MTDNPAVDAAAFVALPPCDVLVSHSPPLGCRDKTHSGARIGSPGLRAYIEREAPQLVLCGHCHEAHGEEWLGKTRVINLADGGRLLRL